MKRSTSRLLTLLEVQTLTGKKVSTWRKAVAEKKVPYVRLGRSVRIPKEFIDQLIEDGWHDPIDGKEV